MCRAAFCWSVLPDSKDASTSNEKLKVCACADCRFDANHTFEFLQAQCCDFWFSNSLVAVAISWKKTGAELCAVLGSSCLIDDNIDAD